MPSVEELRYEANNLVLALVGSKELADEWWITTNKYFNGISPSVIWSYNPDSVLNYLRGYSYCL